ncbi:MAG: MFS transporter [Runella sp.]
MKILAYVLCFLAYLFGGTASTLMSVYLPVAVPELLGHTNISEARLGEVGAFINAAFLYGWMLGGFVFGVVSDRIGRVSSLALVTGLYGLAMVLTVFVPDWLLLLVLRFATGMGVGGVLLIATVYISEIWPLKTRPIALGILAVAFPVGIVATGSLNVLIADWRLAFWLGLVSIALAVLIWFLAEESAAWKNGKTAIERSGGRLWDKENRTNLLVGMLVFGSVLIGLWGIFSWLPTWVQSLLPAGQDGQQQRGMTMMLLGMGGIVGGIFSGFLIRALGIRKTLILTFSGLTVCCLALFLTNKDFSAKIYVEMGILSLFFGISQGALSSFIPQLFPVSIRATASGFCFNVGRFFTASAVFFVGVLVSVLGGFGQALLTFSIAFMVALAATFFNKEWIISDQ